MKRNKRKNKVSIFSGIISVGIIIVVIMMGGDINDVIRMFSEDNNMNQDEWSMDFSMQENNNSSKKIIKYEKIVIDRVVDGDTFVYYKDDESIRVRLLGVDTPESVKEKRYEFFGNEASDFTHEKLEGKTVYLEKDKVSKDQYDRQLRYIWLNEPNEENLEYDCFNAILIRNGYARAVVYDNNDKYYDLFVAYEKQAKEEKKGMWQD